MGNYICINSNNFCIMLKIKSILVSLLAVVALASCSNENLEENPEVEGGAGYDVAYVSIV